MYGIFSYIWLIFMGNVGQYTMHGCYGCYGLGESHDMVESSHSYSAPSPVSNPVDLKPSKGVLIGGLIAISKRLAQKIRRCTRHLMPGILDRMACGVALALAIGRRAGAADPPPPRQKTGSFLRSARCA